MDAGFISQYDPSTDDGRKPRPAWQVPTQAWLRRREAACSVQLNSEQTASSLGICVLVSRQIGNVGLLDGGGKMTEGGQGERERLADVRQCWMKVTGNEQTTAVLVSYLSPLSVPDASWLLLLLECPGGWFITSRKQRELLGSWES